MAFKNLSKEKQQEIRFKYRAKQYEQTRDWARRKSEAGIAASVRMTEAARDRKLMREIQRKADNHQVWCRWAVAKMCAGMPMTARLRDKAAFNDKAARHRHRKKARAIAALGGCCSRCGFDDPRALHFDHVISVRRGLSGLRKSAKTGYETHAAVLRGETDGIQLLCANCHAIKTSDDATLSLNMARSGQRTNVVEIRPRRRA